MPREAQSPLSRSRCSGLLASADTRERSAIAGPPLGLLLCLPTLAAAPSLDPDKWLWLIHRRSSLRANANRTLPTTASRLSSTTLQIPGLYRGFRLRGRNEICHRNLYTGKNPTRCRWCRPSPAKQPGREFWQATGLASSREGPAARLSAEQRARPVETTRPRPQGHPSASWPVAAAGDQRGGGILGRASCREEPSGAGLSRMQRSPRQPAAGFGPGAWIGL